MARLKTLFQPENYFSLGEKIISDRETIFLDWLETYYGPWPEYSFWPGLKIVSALGSIMFSLHFFKSIFFWPAMQAMERDSMSSFVLFFVLLLCWLARGPKKKQSFGPK